MTGDFKRRATTVPNSRIHSTSVRSIDTVAPRPAFETKRYHSRASWLDSFFSLANFSTAVKRRLKRALLVEDVV